MLPTFFEVLVLVEAGARVTAAARGALNDGVSESRKLICFHTGTFPSPTSRPAPEASGPCPDPNIISGSVLGGMFGGVSAIGEGKRIEMRRLEDFSY